MPDALIKAWKTIWSLSPDDLGGEKSCKIDYEIYDERASDHANVVLDICIGMTN